MSFAIGFVRFREVQVKGDTIPKLCLVTSWCASSVRENRCVRVNTMSETRRRVHVTQSPQFCSSTETERYLKSGWRQFSKLMWEMKSSRRVLYG